MKGLYVKFRNIMEYFLVFCFCGWIYESFWCEMVEKNHGFTNKGYLFGPWLMIYGFGMLLIVFILRRFKVTNGYLILLYATLISTVVELIGSYIMEAMFGHFFWDYSPYFMNFQGRIAFKQDLMFGLMALMGMKILLPKVDILQEKYSDNIVHNLAAILIIMLYFVDLIARIWLGSNI